MEKAAWLIHRKEDCRRYILRESASRGRLISDQSRRHQRPFHLRLIDAALT